MGKILIVPMMTFGHFSCCINIGRLLIEKHPEHEVYFLVSDKWANKLKVWEPRFKSLVFMKDEDTWKKSIEKRREKLKMQGIEMSEKYEGNKNDALIKLISESGETWKKPCIEKIKGLGDLCKGLLDTQYDYRDKIEQLVNELDPEVIAFDNVVMTPFLLNRKWIQIVSMCPLVMEHHELPPYSSGLSSNKKIAFEEWKKFRLVKLESTADYLLYLNSKLVEEGQQLVRPMNLIAESPFFNIYMYPKEIDYYSDKIQLPGRWIQIDSSFLPAKRVDLLDSNDREGRFERIKELYDVPENFFESESKVVYFSLGSMASGYKKIVDRLFDMISKVPNHRFIVSKGPLDDEVILPSNCVGKAFVDQFETLKVCDLMISHGGNNTLAECFHMGVKLIIMPLFSDQPDNAQRLIDTNTGYKLDAFKCTQEDFNKTIDEALNNEELTMRMKAISERIRADNGMNRAVKELHDLIIA